MNKEKELKKIDKNNIRFNIMAILLIAIFCFSISPITLQNDTFYTIKIGEHILENGIDMKDPFSYHDLKYTYPHWLYDVSIYLIYSIGGHVGIYLSTVFLAITLGLVLYSTNVKLMKNRVTSFIITIGAMYLMRPYIAARAQLVTFILFVLTIYFIEQFLETRKKRYAIGLILIPIFIANLHLAVFPFYFVLYLPYIGEYIIYILSNAEIIINTSKIDSLHKKLKKINDEEEINGIKEKILKLEERIAILQARHKRINENPYKIKMIGNNAIKALIIIMIICIFTGFLTPLGDTPYTYLIKTMQGNTTKNISEHLPLVLINEINYIALLMIIMSILIFTDTKIRLSDLFMLGGLIILSLYSGRQISMVVLASPFILNRLICSMFDKYDPEGCDKIQKSMTKIIGMTFTICLVLIISITNYRPKIRNNFIDKKRYPVEATQYILDNLDLNNIRLFNQYNFGSYLLYKEVPVFLDSRADLYTPEFNKGVEVFNDYLSLSNVSKENIEEILDKYGITHLIMYNDCKLRIFIKQDEEKYKLLYEDDYFCIYERSQLQENK